MTTAGRKRAAIELAAREGAELRRFARGYSLCEDDAEDAYQRALEILLVKAPSERPRELVAWMKTVLKREAMALRAYRERMLGVGADEVGDPVERLSAEGIGPDERLEQREQLARSREALRTLKPAELRSLTLRAAGYSYVEIAKITGFSASKVNRSLATGRARFHRQLTRSEDGSRCADLLPLLSAYCDGEASIKARTIVREHLRACPACRATMRSFRAVPATVAALTPTLSGAHSLLGRVQELLLGLHSRLPGIGRMGDSSTAQVAVAGGARGAGTAALAKALAICAGTVGGAAACVAAGVTPVPLGLEPQHTARAKIERVSERAVEEVAPPAVEYEPAAPQVEADKPPPEPSPDPEAEAEAEVGVAPEATDAGAVEYAAAPAETSPAPPTTSSSGSAAGEFGP
jgi:RNA polymerase sigma factor (sigma-70 family)